MHTGYEIGATRLPQMQCIQGSHKQLQSTLPHRLSRGSQQLSTKPLGLAAPTNQDHNQSNSTIKCSPNFWHMHILAGPLTTIKFHSLQWDVRPRYMRKPTSMVRGHIICSTDGISSHHQNTIAHTIVISSTPRANDYPTQSNFNTNASPIHPSHTPTK